jgi:hypothetical protein
MLDLVTVLHWFLRRKLPSGRHIISNVDISWTVGPIREHAVILNSCYSWRKRLVIACLSLDPCWSNFAVRKIAHSFKFETRFLLNGFTETTSYYCGLKLKARNCEIFEWCNPWLSCNESYTEFSISLLPSYIGNRTEAKRDQWCLNYFEFVLE